MNCLEKCLDEFSDENRRLIVAYYDTNERTMIEARKRLADKMENFVESSAKSGLPSESEIGKLHAGLLSQCLGVKVNF